MAKDKTYFFVLTLQCRGLVKSQKGRYTAANGNDMYDAFEYIFADSVKAFGFISEESAIVNYMIVPNDL